MKSIVLNEGKIAHYNVNMAVESIYEAFLPKKDAKIKITPKDKYAKIVAFTGVDGYTSATPSRATTIPTAAASTRTTRGSSPA